jgi:ribosomal protein S18 acetylase RimI-like enzyme
MEIRPVRSDEYEPLGAITLNAYLALDGAIGSSDYQDNLRDVRARAEAPATIVLVAVDDNGLLLGGVTYVSDVSSPLAEFDEEGTAGIRMLAVDPRAQRRGAGVALSRACLDRARADGRRQVVLHSTRDNVVAHSLYEGLGFERAPDLDWSPVEGVNLVGFRLSLAPPG